jgi:ABC-type sugar transport system substrate-binding protein
MSGINRRDFLKATSVASIAGVAGCTGNIGGGSNQNNKLERLGISMYVRGGSWITAFREAAKFYCEDQSIEVNIAANQQSAQQQAQDIRQFASQNFDGIITSIWSTGAVETAIKTAMDQGVPVFAANADSSSPKIPLYVGFSNFAGGRKSGEAMVDTLKKQKSGKDTWRVLNVRGPFGNRSADLRSEGFVKVAKNNDKLKIIDTINAHYSQTESKQKVGQWVNANGKPDGIYSGNLSMGLGVKTALEQLGMLVPQSNPNHIVLTQMDGSPEVNPLIDQGLIDAAVDQPNYFYMPIAIKYMQKYIESGGIEGGGADAIPKVGTTIKEGDLTIEDAKHKGVNLWSVPIWSPAPMRKQNGHPWFQTNSILITKENAQKPYLWGNIWG